MVGLKSERLDLIPYSEGASIPAGSLQVSTHVCNCRLVDLRFEDGVFQIEQDEELGDTKDQEEGITDAYTSTTSLMTSPSPHVSTLRTTQHHKEVSLENSHALHGDSLTETCFNNRYLTCMPWMP